jgi:hypothetical protein
MRNDTQLGMVLLSTTQSQTGTLQANSARSTHAEHAYHCHPFPVYPPLRTPALSEITSVIASVAMLCTIEYTQLNRQQKEQCSARHCLGGPRWEAGRVQASDS